MRGNRIAFLGRSQEPMGRFLQIGDHPRAGRAQAPHDELGACVAKLGRLSIPDIGLAEVRLDMRAAAIELG